MREAFLRGVVPEIDIKNLTMGPKNRIMAVDDHLI